MAVVDVLNNKAEKVSRIDLSDDVFCVSVKPSVLHEVTTMQLAGRRSGSASVKHRSDVKGSGRKLFRQKGTGRARRGDIKAPLLRGGGSVFGPDPRSYSYRVPRKVRRLALKMALSSKLKDNNLVVLDRFELDGTVLITTKKSMDIDCDHLFFLKPPFGPYPEELSETYPVGPSEIPKTLDHEAMVTAVANIRRLIELNPHVRFIIACEKVWEEYLEGLLGDRVEVVWIGENGLNP